MLYKVKRKSISDPVDDKRVLIKEKLSACFRETFDIADLCLEQCEITEDLNVFRSIVQCFFVAINRFLVVSIRSVDDAVNVPSDITFHVLI